MFCFSFLFFEHTAFESLLRDGATLGGRGYKSLCCVSGRTWEYCWPTVSVNKVALCISACNGRYLLVFPWDHLLLILTHNV